MRNIRLVISYDGSLFFGSQAQKDKRTIQGSIEEAIYGLTGTRARIVLAGRTDRGVHAFSQVANFCTNSSIPAEKFPFALKRFLCKEIIIRSAVEVPLSFNSRRDAKKREYLYFVYNGRDLPVFYWDRVYDYPRSVDLKRVRSAAKQLLGRHNFFNFCAKDKDQKNYIRKIYKLDLGYVGRDMVKEFDVTGKLMYFRIVADSFLYKMVRFIVGALLDAGSGRLSAKDIKEMLNGKAVKFNRSIVPSCGLYLSKVKY